MLKIISIIFVVYKMYYLVRFIQFKTIQNFFIDMVDIITSGT
jgi:hypothetical protein